MNSMTSSNHTVFRHAFKQAVKENGVLLMVGVIAFCVLIPVSTAGIPSMSIFNIDYTHDQMKLRFFASQMTSVINFGTLLLGVLVGFVLFKFLLDKRQTSFYLTLGLSRSSLFFARYLAGVLMTAVIILLPMILSFGLNIIAFGLTERMIDSFIYTSLGLLLLGLNGLAFSAVACALAGTPGESLFYSGILLMLPTAICYGVGTLMRQLLYGNAYGMYTYSGTMEIQSSLMTLLSKWNPALFFYDSLKQYSVFYEGANSLSPKDISFSLAIYWIPVAIIFALIALMLFKRRRAEKAGISGKSDFLIAVGLFTSGLALFAAVTEALSSFHMPIALLAATGAVMAWSMAFISTLVKTRVSFIKKLLTAVSPLPAVWAVALLLISGGLGFSNDVPRGEKVMAAVVSYTGTPNYLGSNIQGSSTGGGYYVMSDHQYTDRSDIDSVLSVQQCLVDMGKQPLGEDNVDFAKSVLPYDIVFNYTMNDGTKKTRYYNRATVSILQEMLSLDGTKSVREDARKAVTGGAEAEASGWGACAYQLGDIYLTGSWYQTPLLLTLSKEERTELLDCIASDISQQSVKDRYFSEKPPKYILMFTQNGETDRQSYRYQLQNAFVYVTEHMTQTLEFIKNHGFIIDVNTTPPIEQIVLQKYQPYGVVNNRIKPRSLYFQGYISNVASDFITVQDFGLPYTVSDSDKLAALTPKLRNDYFMSDGGYLASIKLAGSNTYVYKYLPTSDAPDDIKRALG